MKKRVMLLLAGLFFCLAVQPANASGDIKLVIDGVAVQPEQPLLLLEERVYVPMRYLGEYLGAQVDYMAQTKEDSAHVQITKQLDMDINEQVLMYYGDHRLQMHYTIDGQGYDFTKTAPQTMALINGVSYIPLRTAAETLHCRVWWQGDTQTVVIDRQEVEKTALIRSIQAAQQAVTADDLSADKDALEQSVEEMKAQADALKEQIEALENNTLVQEMQDKKDSGALEADKAQLEEDKAKLKQWKDDLARLQEKLAQ